MLDLMVDLETLGKRPGCVVLSIGAVFFDPIAGILGPEFYQTIDMHSSICAGLHVDASTLEWWMRQAPEARKVFEDLRRVSLNSALLRFRNFVCDEQSPQSVRLWGNGAAFDNAVLSAAYHAVALQHLQPWEFWNDRCYRTLKNLYPAVMIERTGTHHNALDDAKSQALHALAIFKSSADFRITA